MTTPTPAPKQREHLPSVNMHDARYAQRLNAFCVRCKTDTSRQGGTNRNGMFFCVSCR